MMRPYLDIVCNTLEKGHWQENRTGTRTLAVPNQHFSCEMSDGFPALTTKHLAFRSMCVELEGFIKGITSKKWYQERKCKIWNEWANPLAVDVDLKAESARHGCAISVHDPANRKQAQEFLDDLGPIYGYQWRRFGEVYDPDDDAPTKGYDQFKYIVDTLKSNPNDRRLVCTAWNPNQLSRMALPACHLLWVATAIDGVLSLHWTQRSCDLMLGVPFNIASYGMLLHLLCLESGLKPGNLSGMLCNCHIYENQLPMAEEQCGRTPGQLPYVQTNWRTGSIFDWTHEDSKLMNYEHQGKIDFGKVAI